MNTEIDELVNMVKLRSSQVIVVSGNIQDEIKVGEVRFMDMSEYLEKVSEKKFKQFIKYDLFSGIFVVRGDTEEIRAQMSIKKNDSNGSDPNSDLMQTLRGAGMVRSSEFPSKPLDVFHCFNSLLHTDKAQTFILIEYSQSIFGEDPMTPSRENEFSIALKKWSRDPEINKNGHLVVLLCRDESGFSRSVLDRAYGICHIRINKPNLEELAGYMKDQKVKDDPTVLAKISRGLALYDLSAISGNVTTESITRLKRKVFAQEYGDVLKFLDSPFGFDAIGGMRKQINELSIVANDMKAGNVSAVPQGIMFVGPPGTGKTLMAQALAKEAGVNCVTPSDIKNMLVGKSEERMTRFINALMKDLAPVIVFVDEFDQNQAQRGSYDGDSGTSRKIFQKLLEAMSDISQRGRILWIIASNRPDLIDAAIKRPGRCDVRVPFLLPTPSELEPICRAALIQYPDIRTCISDWSKFTA